MIDLLVLAFVRLSPEGYCGMTHEQLARKFSRLAAWLRASNDRDAVCEHSYRAANALMRCKQRLTR